MSAFLKALASFAVFVTLCLATVADARAAKRHLTLADYLNFERVADPQVSADGNRILYTRRWVDNVNDRWSSAIWIMDADGGRNRFLVEGQSPIWSPDGTRIAFIREGEPKGPQIFVRWMDAEGAVTQITRLDRTPRHIAWSPDSASLAFVSLVPKETPWKIDLPKPGDGGKWTETPRIIQSLDYRQDRIGFTEEGYFHVFVVPASGGTARSLTSGDYNHGSNRQPISWTPDGSEILFSSLREPEWEYAWRESEIYAVNTLDKSIRKLTDRKGPDQNPVVSPDGKLVAYTGNDWTNDTYIASKLYVMGIDGSSPTEIATDLDRSPRGVTWSADSSGVFFNVRDRGTSNLYFASRDDGVRAATEGTHMLDVTHVGGNGRAVGTLTSFHQPGDIALVDLESGSIEQLTFVNDDVLADIELGSVDEIWYDSLDDYRIQGWVVTPPDYDPARKYPMMLAIHGGPHGMYHTGFNFGWQEHAANGYVVLYTNPRGSSGYGSAFGNAIKNAYPSKDFDDLMKGVDEVLAKGFVDDRNLFVYGCSGGGVLTAWVVGHTDRFAAASSNCPVTNWLSFVGTTDGPNWYRNFAKMFWEDPSEHLERSPLMYVGNVTTPTMLMTGVKDLRTPITQTEEYYQALKMRKVPTAMVRFNEEFHGTSSKPSNFMRTQLYLRHWFEKHGSMGETRPPTENP